MPWLLRDGQVLATLEVADSFDTRLKGLLGRESLPGALLLRKVRSVHTIGMKFAIDVAFCDESLRVVDVCSLRPNRISRPRRRASSVVEAEAGSFERWGLACGDQLEIRGA